MDMLEEYIRKSGYAPNGIVRPVNIELANVFAAIQMAEDGVTPDGSCSDATCNIYLAVKLAIDHAITKKKG